MSEKIKGCLYIVPNDEKIEEMCGESIIRN